MFNPLKRVLLGTPLPSSQAPHERLTKVTGLAVLSSDALSSVAYATDAMLAVLVPARLLAVGATPPMIGHFPAAAAAASPQTGLAGVGLFVLLHAFANGCTAMTGVEAISNGIPAFEPPEADNAAKTLLIMAAILLTSPTPDPGGTSCA